MDLEAIARENLRIRWAREEASRRVKVETSAGLGTRPQRASQLLQMILSEHIPAPSRQALAKELTKIQQLKRLATDAGEAIEQITQVEHRPLERPEISADKIFQVYLSDYRCAVDPDAFLRSLSAQLR